MAEMELKKLNSEVARYPRAAIERAEKSYHEKVTEVAESVVSHSDVRILLIAGPSGSGKTTTANLIADAVRRLGEEAIVVSLDDFYRDCTDPDYPRLEGGERDLECPDALHLSEIARALGDIAAGRDFFLPKYDFKESRRVSLSRHGAMPDGCVIIEGLHALNPRISDTLPRESVMKLFISVSTNVNDSGVRIISGRKIRFLRRLVRDSIYRGADGGRTLELWHHVLAAEDSYLYPYKATADVAFDTFHTFELGVMKQYAMELLTPKLVKSDSYAATVFRAVERVTPVPESLVPMSSLIREFIPGGIYESLY